MGLTDKDVQQHLDVCLVREGDLVVPVRMITRAEWVDHGRGVRSLDTGHGDEEVYSLTWLREQVHKIQKDCNEVKRSAEQVVEQFKAFFLGELNWVELSLWSEGYQATGERSTAQYLGKWPSLDGSVRDALRVYACAASIELRRVVNPERETIWGCKVFDNEADARKRYG